MYNSLESLHITFNTLPVCLQQWEYGRLTIMIPQKNMRNESHIDGRNRFKNTLEGTSKIA